MKKQWIVLLLLAALLLGACSKPAPAPQTPAETPAETPAADVATDVADNAPWNEDLIAKVGEKELPRKTYNALVALATYNYIDMYGKEVVEQETFPMEDLKQSTREDFVMGSVVAQLAEGRGIPLNVEMVNQINTNFSAQVEANSDFAEFLKDEGVSHEDLLPYIEMQSYFDALLESLREEVMASDKYKETIGGAELVHARHILLDGAAEGAEDAAKALLEELKANPGTFEEVAKEQSIDPGSASLGGDLGYFAMTQMVPEFSAAAFGAQTGDLVMTKSQFGYHIIEVLDKSTVADLEAKGMGELIAQSKAALMNPLLNELYTAEIERMQEKLPIEYFALEKNE